MTLFSPDLFKAFSSGFLIAAAAMSPYLAPGLWNDVVPQALAAIVG